MSSSNLKTDAGPAETGPVKTAAARPKAVFIEGSTMGHVVRMTVTSSVGLMAIFLVDFLSLLYVSWLKSEALTAAVGYASVVLFFLTSANIGFMIATTALAAKRLGAGDREGAKRIATSSLVLMVLAAAILWLVLLPVLKPLLALLGAEGEVQQVAWEYLQITLPSNILMALGMGFSGMLRAVGDANRAMYVTLSGGIVTAVIDPILIFTLGLGVYGAALCVVLSRAVFAFVGWYGAVKVHRMMARPTVETVRADTEAVFAIAGPAILTNVATPFSLAVVARIVSVYGPWAIAANTVIDRLTPIAFGALFALSGAVGPILAQNWGAGYFHRMRAVMRDSFLFTLVYVSITWIVLILCRYWIVDLFALTGPAADGVIFFCWISGIMWLFLGMLFTANAAFNNLGFPLYSTAFNWGRATLGTIPFAWLGAQYYGYKGALGGITLGAVVFGIASAIMAMRAIKALELKAREASKAAVAESPANA
ncbi:MAG: MATE family efflux transporter [Beijerinckiaceae bacterium]